jgi:transcriptional regulator with XRE-family HTH domain
MMENLRNIEIDVVPGKGNYYAGLFQHLFSTDSTAFARLADLWAQCEPRGSGRRIVVQPRWRLSTGELLSFNAITTELSAADGSNCFEWHPADAFTCRWYAAARWLEGDESPNLFKLGEAGLNQTPFVLPEVADWRATLRFARDCAGLSRRELSRRLDGRVSVSAIASYEGARPRHLRTPPRETLLAMANKLGLAAATTNAMCEQLGYAATLSDWALFMAGEPVQTDAPHNDPSTIKRPENSQIVAEINPHPFPCLVFRRSDLRVLGVNKWFRALTRTRGRLRPELTLRELLVGLIRAGHIANGNEVADSFENGNLRRRTRLVLPVLWKTTTGALYPFNVVVAKWNPFIDAWGMDWHGASPEACEWVRTLTRNRGGHSF